MCDHKRNRGWHTVRAFLASWLLLQAGTPPENLAAAPPPKLKVRGYLTARVDDTTVAILDDQIHCTSAKIVAHDSSGDRPITGGELATGMLVEPEGSWTGHHQFTAERVTVDAGLLEKQIHYAAYRVEYHGTRLADGKISAEKVALGAPAPADAYKMPHGLEVVRAKDPQTGIDILEFRRGKKVDGRMKLFPDKTVQTYVSDLGDSLLPAGTKGTTKALEFRFFVIEDSSINAAALPDGTILVNTALLGAIENGSQLAFILSHEISHVLQVHYWREVHETRQQRIGLLVAGIAAGAFIGDLGVFMAELGMISVINGHQRELENQADRLGLQNVIEHGYDPRPAPGFMRIIIERYGIRSTSKLWSNHDSALLRGSFLTVQLMKQYPDHHFDGARVNTAAFDSMHDALGPVRIE